MKSIEDIFMKVLNEAPKFTVHSSEHKDKFESIAKKHGYQVDEFAAHAPGNPRIFTKHSRYFLGLNPNGHWMHGDLYSDNDINNGEHLEDLDKHLENFKPAKDTSKDH